MSPDVFFGPLADQSLLIPGQDERFRGQCVQSVGLYVEALGLEFPAYINAYLYYDNGIAGYTKIKPGNPIQPGDIIVWGKNFPASPGAGHIDVASQNGTLASFVAWDSNWYPPLKLAKLTHTGNNNNFIAGYLRRVGDDMPPIGDESTVRSLATTLNVPLTDTQVTYYAARTYGNFYSDVIGLVNQQRIDGQLKSDGVNYAFQLGMGRPATADEINYWQAKNPNQFLAAVYGTKTTGPSEYNKQGVVDYINVNLK